MCTCTVHVGNLKLVRSMIVSEVSACVLFHMCSSYHFCKEKF